MTKKLYGGAMLTVDCTVRELAKSALPFPEVAMNELDPIKIPFRMVGFNSNRG